MKTSFRQTAVVHIAQTMNLYRQTHRTTVQLREEILQLRRIGMHLRQVCPQIGVGHIRQSNSRHVSLQHGFAVIAQHHIAESNRVQRTAHGSGQAQRPFERLESRDEKRYLRRHQLRIDMKRCIQRSGVQRQAQDYLAQRQTGLRQARTQRRHGEQAVRQDHMRIQILCRERQGRREEG